MPTYKRRRRKVNLNDLPVSQKSIISIAESATVFLSRKGYITSALFPWVGEVSMTDLLRFG